MAARRSLRLDVWLRTRRSVSCNDVRIEKDQSNAGFTSRGCAKVGVCLVLPCERVLQSSHLAHEDGLLLLELVNALRPLLCFGLGVAHTLHQLCEVVVVVRDDNDGGGRGGWN
jgi:hypothetical protein